MKRIIAVVVSLVFVCIGMLCLYILNKQYFFGYSFSIIVGLLVISPFMDWLVWPNIIKKYPKINITRPMWLASTLGILERIIYTSVIILGKPEGIAVYLAFKIVAKRQTSEDEEKSTIVGAIYLIGSILNIIFGVLGGLIAIGFKSDNIIKVLLLNKP